MGTLCYHAMAHFDLVCGRRPWHRRLVLPVRWPGARRGLRVAVLERGRPARAQRLGANFGFVTVVAGRRAGSRGTRALQVARVWCGPKWPARRVIEGAPSARCGDRRPAGRGDGGWLEELRRRAPWVRAGELWPAAAAREAVLQRGDLAIAGALLEPPRAAGSQARGRACRSSARWLLRNATGVVFAWETIALEIDGTRRAPRLPVTFAPTPWIVAPGAAVATFAPGLAKRVNLPPLQAADDAARRPGLRAARPVVLTDLRLLGATRDSRRSPQARAHPP
jgi:hypothetical protein